LVKPLLLSKVEMPANAMQILLDDDVLASSCSPLQTTRLQETTDRVVQ
jgi:hypothetical protein